MTVTLDTAEIYLASQVGLRRNIEAMARGLKPKHGFTGSNWDIHIEGACGEMAFAKAAGLYWNGSVNSFKAGGDVGSHQVRTRSKPDYQLIVRADDQDNVLFWLVTGQCPVYTVKGCMMGRLAKNEKYLRDYGNRPPAYFVDNDDLTSLETYLKGKTDGQSQGS